VKIVGGKIISDKSNEVGAFVTAIQRGGIADQLHGELQEGITALVCFPCTVAQNKIPSRKSVIIL